MSGAREVAVKAVDRIEALIAEMLDGDYANNETLLGTILCGDEEIQVQLKVTRAECEFLDD